MTPWGLFLALVLAAGAVSGAPHAARAGATRAERASALLASANRRIALGTHEQRQFALTELRDAAALDPGRADILLALGRFELDCGLVRQSLRTAQRLLAGDSTVAVAWRFEGEAWRRAWLTSIDEEARDRSIASLAHAARLEPRDPVTWRLLAPLLADAEEPGAFDAAVLAARTAPGDAWAQALLAAATQRAGDLANAERWFRAAVPRLPPARRERYEDVAPLLPAWTVESYRRLDTASRERFVERFWAEHDPDPVSVENEARLEYWARVTQALALYDTSRPGEWDMRAQYFVRFGRPDLAELNPLYMPAKLRIGDWLVWTYADLGVRVWMGAPGTSFMGFSEPLSDRSMTVFAAPDSLARRGNLSALHHGWAVFHRLPPGVEPLETRLALAQFQANDAVRLLAQAESPGGIADSLAVEWVVLDSLSAPVVRERRWMSPSACRAEEARAASFTATLAPGPYTVSVQVSDARGRRGSVTRRIFASSVTEQLALSDVVVTCSPPALSVVAGSSVRLEPQTGLFPAPGDQLNAYFEIYHLATGPGGDARFEYDCAVRPATRDPRGWLSRVLAPREQPPAIHVNRTETTPGPLRRQFLGVPVGALPAGRYEIELRVLDVASREQARSLAWFERGP